MQNSLKQNHENFKFTKTKMSKTTFKQEKLVEDLLKNIDCIQETKENSSVIEFNWLVDDIIAKVSEKSSGEKIESEEFYFKNADKKLHKHQELSCECQKHQENQDLCGDCRFNQMNKDSKLFKANLDCEEMTKSIENQILFENFLKFSKWKLEITPLDEHLSIQSILIESFNKDKLPSKLQEALKQGQSNISFMLKTNFYIMNNSMDEIYFKKSLEETNQLNDQSKLRFGSDQFCKINDLITWLNQKRSKDFCLLTEYKIYHQKSLSKSFKHAWTIKGWKNFFQIEANYEQDFKLESRPFTLQEEKNKNLSFDKHIENTLEQVKWKLQLYPKGYNLDFSDYLSLFLTFNDITPMVSGHIGDDQMDLSFLVQRPVSSPNDSFNKVQKLPQHETLVKACFQIAIKDENGKKVDSCQSEKQLFELYGSWGYKEYLPIKDLLECKERYLNEKKLHLNCKITLFYTLNTRYYINYTDEMANLASEMIKNNIAIKSTLKLLDFKQENRMKSFYNGLGNDLSRLYKSSDMFDLIVQAPISLESDTQENKKLKNFKVHKLVLSMRSVVLEKMFNENFKLSTKTFKTIDQKTIQIEVLQIIDFDAYTVDLFLKYLYTDSIDLNHDDFLCAKDDTQEDDLNASNNSLHKFDENSLQAYTSIFVELFKISDKYCVYGLHEVCEYRLIQLINHTNLIQLLILAYLHNSYKLKQKCFSYLAKNVRDIIKQKNWSYLEDNYPNLLAEAFRMFYFK